MEIFNNREIATGIWLFIIFIFIITKQNFRKSLPSLIKSFFQTKVITIFLIILIYTSAIVISLYFLKFWNISLLKDTIIWFFFIGIVICINSITSKDYDNLFKKIIVDNIKIIIVYEFIVNVYAFHIIAEFFFVPFVTFIVLLDTVASIDKKNIALSKILKILQFLIGLSVLGYSIYKIITDFKNFMTLNTLKDFLLAPVLTISFLPFIYIILLFTSYEQIFVRLNLGYKKDKKLINYSKKEIIKYCLLSLKKVNNILRNNIHELMSIKDNSDIRNLINSLKVKN